MLKKIKRSADFELRLEIHNERFFETPRDSQRTWFLNRLMKEFSDDLNHLNDIAKDLIPGAEATVDLERAQTRLLDHDIMEDWQIPIMEQMATSVAQAKGDVLEIGMGRGIASDFVQSHHPKSHTLVECNDSIANQFPAWQAQYPNSDVRFVHGLWQDVWDELDYYDGILFHTYPLTSEEFVDLVVKSSTFAEHFFQPAAQRLRDGGVLSYLTNENDSLSRAHQRSLLRHFSSFTVSLIHDLDIPRDTRDSCWLPQMVMVSAIK